MSSVPGANAAPVGHCLALVTFRHAANRLRSASLVWVCTGAPATRTTSCFFRQNGDCNRNSSTSLMHARREAYTSRLVSTNTSLVEGTWSPAPGDPLTPNRDEATAFAVEHAKRQLQRLNHAAPALPYNLRGSEAAFAHARHHSNASASWDHLPPTFARARPAGTTLGMSSPSIYGPLPELDRRWHQPCVGECRLSGVVTPLRRQWPVGTSHTRSIHRHRLPDGVNHSCVVTGCQDPSSSRPWTPWLRPPEISERWHILLQNPSCPEALLCCTQRGPKASSGRPHRQVHAVQGKGRRKQQHAEWLGIQLRHAVDWHRGERDGTRWATLRSHQCPLVGGHLGPHHIDAVVFVHRL